MKISDVMTGGPQFCTTSDTLVDCAQLMAQRDLGIENRVQRPVGDTRFTKANLLGRRGYIGVERIDATPVDEEGLGGQAAGEFRMVQLPRDGPVKDRAAALEFNRERISVLSQDRQPGDLCASNPTRALTKLRTASNLSGM